MFESVFLLDNPTEAIVQHFNFKNYNQSTHFFLLNFIECIVFNR